MRTIKFRGQFVYTNALTGQLDWVYGDLVHYPEHIGKHKIVCEGGAEFEVLGSTIGEFTGLHDKNGTEIYEGDIVECVSWNEYFSKNGQPMEAFRRKMYIDFRNGGFKMIEPMPTPLEEHVWDIIYNGDIDVIGNIHDNPELLKGEKE